MKTFFDSFKGLVPCEPVARITGAAAYCIGVRFTADHAPYSKGELRLILARDFVKREKSTGFSLRCSTAPLPDSLPTMDEYDFRQMMRASA